LRRRSTAYPFLLPASPGERFCILHRPADTARARGGFVFVPPFAEEMNKSRRMVALQARRFGELGFATLVLDLHGCGESSGDFGEARLSTWEQDISTAVAWMVDAGYAPVRLWGLRFGALLAANVLSASAAGDIAGLLLWQPVLSGESQLTQFLRIGAAADMLSGSGSGGSAALRKRLDQGEALEVAGYTLSPGLAAAMGRLRLGDALPAVRTDWLEVTADATNRALPPGALRVIDAWRAREQQVEADVVVGDPFWATVEIAQCPALIERTVQCIDR
jgi:exosortase A-associated hydrolase 2